MQKAVELVVDGLTLRGMMHVPGQGTGKYPFVAAFHGFTGHKAESQFMFVRLSRELERLGIGSIRFDFSGSGESDGLFQDLTASREILEAKAIYEYMSSLDNADRENLFMIGLSMGGMVAGIAAAESPNVKGIVLWAPAGNIALIGEEGFKREFSYEIPPGTIDVNGMPLGKGFLDDVRMLKTYERAANYKGNVLIVHGTDDKTVPIQFSYKYKDIYSENAKLIEIEGADHTFTRFDWKNRLISNTVNFIKELADKGAHG